MDKRLNVYVTNSQLAKLKKLSKETGAPISVLIRRAIDAYFAGHLYAGLKEQKHD